MNDTVTSHFTGCFSDLKHQHIKYCNSLRQNKGNPNRPSIVPASSDESWFLFHTSLLEATVVFQAMLGEPHIDCKGNWLAVLYSSKGYQRIAANFWIWRFTVSSGAQGTVTLPNSSKLSSYSNSAQISRTVFLCLSCLPVGFSSAESVLYFTGARSNKSPGSIQTRNIEGGIYSCQTSQPLSFH